MGMGSSPSGETTTSSSQVAEPWAPVQPYLKDIYSNAQTNFNNPLSYYNGQTVAPFSSLQNQAFSTAGNLGSAGTPQVGQAANNYVTNLLNNPIAPGSPAFDKQFQATSNMIAPQVASMFGRAGAGNSSAFADTMGQQLANAYAQQGQSQQALNLQAAGMAPALAQSDMGNQINLVNMLSGMGAQQQGEVQSQIQSDMSKYNFNQMAPWQQLQLYQQMISGAMPNTPQVTGTQSSPIYSNPMGGALGGAMTGAKLGSAIPGVGTGLGAVGGGLLGLFQ